MAILYAWRWTGALSSEWSDDNGTQSNWVLTSGSAIQPGFPGFLGNDLAVIDSDASITANNGPGDAQEVHITGGATVTFLSGSFGAGADSTDPGSGLQIDDDSTLILASGATMADTGVLDVVGASSDGTMEVQSGAGFDTFAMTIGADDGTSGEVTVDGATGFEVVQSAPEATDGVLIVGQAGDGSLSITDSLFFAMTTTVAQDLDSSGDLTLDDSTWGGTSLTIGPAGNGTVTIEDNSNVAIGTITVGPNGELDVKAAAGLTSNVTTTSLTLAFGTISVTGGGELVVGGGSAVQGAISVAGTTMIGLGTINGNLVVGPGGVVEADQPLDGTLTVNGNVSGAGTIEPIRTFEANGTIDAATTIQFAAPPLPGTSSGVLQLDVPRGDDGTITGFSVGNTIDVEGLLFTNAVFTPGTGGNPGLLALTNGTDPELDLKVDGDYSPDEFMATPGTTDTLVTLVPCYCPGTLIATPHGDRRVEDLKIGDEVITASGAARPIKWIGWRIYAGRFVRGSRDILPVCIKANALDENVPKRDLWISPHHAMYFEGARRGVLIEAKDLVNGVSIVQAERVEKVEYYHIELDTHDVIIAEGALSETYLDDDNRLMFHNAQDYETLYRDAAVASGSYCAPRLEDGYEVEAVRRRIAARAGLARNADSERPSIKVHRRTRAASA